MTSRSDCPLMAMMRSPARRPAAAAGVRGVTAATATPLSEGRARQEPVPAGASARPVPQEPVVVELPAAVLTAPAAVSAEEEIFMGGLAVLGVSRVEEAQALGHVLQPRHDRDDGSQD